MLPIKTRHYNPLTYQFEDKVEGFNFYPTRYTPLVPETNENDVKIEEIRFSRDINLAKRNQEYNLEIAEKVKDAEIVKELCQTLRSRTDLSIIGTKKIKRGFLFSSESAEIIVYGR